MIHINIMNYLSIERSVSSSHSKPLHSRWPVSILVMPTVFFLSMGLNCKSSATATSLVIFFLSLFLYFIPRLCMYVMFNCYFEAVANQRSVYCHIYIFFCHTENSISMRCNTKMEWFSSQYRLQNQNQQRQSK